MDKYSKEQLRDFYYMMGDLCDDLNAKGKKNLAEEVSEAQDYINSTFEF